MKTLFKVIVGALCITSIVAAIAYISIEETEKYSEIEDRPEMRKFPGLRHTASLASTPGANCTNYHMIFKIQKATIQSMTGLD